MSILEQINQNLTAALKEKNEETVSTLRLLKSALKNKEIELRKSLADEEILEVISKEAKKRKESALAFETGGRQDLAQKEEREYEILKTYLPAQLTEEEIRKIIQETIKELGASLPSDMGKVIGQVMNKVKGQAEGGTVSKIVKEELIK